VSVFACCGEPFGMVSFRAFCEDSAPKMKPKGPPGVSHCSLLRTRKGAHWETFRGRFGLVEKIALLTFSCPRSKIFSSIPRQHQKNTSGDCWVWDEGQLLHNSRHMFRRSSSPASSKNRAVSSNISSFKSAAKSGFPNIHSPDVESLHTECHLIPGNTCPRTAIEFALPWQH
jgi:hypothetical protein